MCRVGPDLAGSRCETILRVKVTLRTARRDFMSLPSAYVETTIPSFYWTERRSAGSIARRDWTRRWWQSAPATLNLVTSRAVLAELAKASTAQARKRTELLRDLPLLPGSDAVAEVVAAYLRHFVMPSDPAGDALHLALASFHGCRFLVTWNCRHLANANKFDHIRRVNTLLGLATPDLVTPLELLGGEDADAD